MTAYKNMPDEMSSLIQDFIRPNPYKKKYDAVVKQMCKYGYEMRYCGQDAMAWGDWVNRLTEWEWDIMVCNGVAPQWLIETEGQYINDEFLGMTIGEQMVEFLYDS